VSADRPPARALAGRLFAYRRALRRAVARRGPLGAAPVSFCFLGLVLLTVLARLDPHGRALVVACCAYRPGEMTRLDGLARLLGSALLVRGPIEITWTVLATWLVLAPLEAVIGPRRLLAVMAVGHVVPTVLAGLDWRWHHGAAMGRLDVGTSAVVVAAAAALAIRTRSLPVAVSLVIGLAADLVWQPDLSAGEHLFDLAVGIAAGLVLTRHRGTFAAFVPRRRAAPAARRPSRPPAAAASNRAGRGQASRRLLQQREDGGVDRDAQGDAGEDLRRRVVAHLDAGPGHQGHHGPGGQHRRAEDEQQHGGGAGRDRGVRRDLPPERDHPADDLPDGGRRQHGDHPRRGVERRQDGQPGQRRGDDQDPEPDPLLPQADVPVAEPALPHPADQQGDRQHPGEQRRGPAPDGRHARVRAALPGDG
jgi:hypothetical protein